MFLKNNNKIVNLKNVSSVVFEGSKVIFNLDYSISLRGNGDKLVPDYVYFYYDYPELIQELKDKLLANGFWNSSTGSVPNRYVNINKISFVKFEEYDINGKEKNRIIFNINTSVSLPGNNSIKTSDALYLDYKTPEDFSNACNEVELILLKDEK